MDARDERFEERLKDIGAALDRKAGPSDPELLGRLLLARHERGGVRSLGRRGRPSQARWYYWAAVLLAVLVAVPYLAHLTPKPGPATHHLRHQTVPRTGLGKPIVLGAVEAVDFLTAKDGYVAAATGAVGSRNVVLATRDGGGSWIERKLPLGYTALALHFTGDRQGTGYVLAQQTGLGQSGATGQTLPLAILATQDGGRTWRVAWSASGSQALQNGSVAMRVGFQSFGSGGYAYVGDTILSTQGGYKGWSALHLPQGFEPVHMDFLTPRVGFVAGQTCPQPPQPGTAAAGCKAVLLETRDGGATWQTSFTAPQATYWSYSDAVSFASAQDGWFFLKDAATWQGYLYQTTDGGRNWTLERSQLAMGRDVAGAPTFVSAKVGWLPNNAGAAPHTEGLLITRDGGRTWHAGGQGQNWSLNGVSLLSPKLGFVAGAGGAQQFGFLVKTTDGGRTWTQLLPSLAPTAQVDFPNARSGFGVGLTSDPQALLATSDGGTTWRRVAELGPQQTQAISFVSARVGFLATSGGQGTEVLATTDGGRSWRLRSTIPLSASESPGLSPYVRFFDSRRGIVQTASFPDVVLEATTDGGRTWTRIYDQAAGKGAFQQFAFRSVQDGYMLTTLPGASTSQPNTVTLAATTDGGQSFKTVHTWQGGGQGAAVFFRSSGQGWVAMQVNPYSQSASTVVLATGDGGRTWSSSSTPMALQDYGSSLQLQFPTGRDGWLMGLTGLYRSQDGGRTWQQMP